MRQKINNYIFWLTNSLSTYLQRSQFMFEGMFYLRALSLRLIGCDDHSGNNAEC